jgi:prepilin-type N-terminal cleavage/methylation domain-containing protein/prepilin-type processing-associated H-X9-DG protein
VRRRFRGFTLIELLVVIAIIALLISILLPSLSRARELSKRLVCASNIKGVGTSAKIYANDNYEKWMVPPFRRQNIDNGGIQFTLPVNGEGYPGQVGKDRLFQTTSESALDPQGGSTEVSVTRAYWMMVRSGDITVTQFICPSSGDEKDQTEDIDFYYDFVHYGNISYGYQVPFGPRDTRAREGMDNRQVVAADKGPWYLDTNQPGDWPGPAGNPINLDDSPKAWRPYNSSNHGGQDNGEGQNCLFADGHATFTRLPAVGIDNDNIYTVMENEWNALPYNRIHGLTPTYYSDGMYPGQNAFGNGAGMHSSTDSLIYP